tara:strand:+ start:156 stop:386 length:231 start_codon:yes stop_codon:yes gene_type:complete
LIAEYPKNNKKIANPTRTYIPISLNHSGCGLFLLKSSVGCPKEGKPNEGPRYPTTIKQITHEKINSSTRDSIINIK